VKISHLWHPSQEKISFDGCNPNVSMKSRFTFFFLFSLLVNVLQAQDPRVVDSLTKALAKAQIRDTSYFDTEYKLAANFVYTDPGGEGLKHSKACVQLADSLQDTVRAAKANNLLANCYKNSGLNDKAMIHYLKALKLFEQAKDEKWISNMHSNIAIIYLNKGDYVQSRKEQEMALAIRQRIGYFKGISGIYNGLGNLYDALNNPKESLRYYQLALDSLANGGTPYDQAIYLGNLGNAYGRLKQYDLARSINMEALVLHRQMGLKQEMSRDMHNVGETFLLQGKPDSAEYYLLLAYATADSVNYHYVKSISADNLRSHFKKQGQFEKAVKWGEIAFAEYDTLHQQQLVGESAAMELAYRVEQQEREDAFEQETTIIQKDAQLKRQRIVNWSMGLGILLLGGFGFVVTRRYREKKQINAVLEQKVAQRTTELQATNEKLKAEVAEKERASKTLSTFIYRSSHDLKGPLTSIQGLVNVAQAVEEQKSYVGLIGDKARQLDGVLQQLIDKVEVDDRIPQSQTIDWQKLWDEVLTQVSQRPGFDQITLSTDFDEATGIQADPILLKTALRQLVQNAIDFRRKDAKGSVVVTAKKDGPKWTLKVEDDGIGISADQQAKVWEMFYRGNNASKGAGLGLYLVREIAVKLNAVASLRSGLPTANEGISLRKDGKDMVTEVTLTFN
jgi:signal transduction histidine kinase